MLSNTIPLSFQNKIILKRYSTKLSEQSNSEGCFCEEIDVDSLLAFHHYAKFQLFLCFSVLEGPEGKKEKKKKTTTTVSCVHCFGALTVITGVHSREAGGRENCSYQKAENTNRGNFQVPLSPLKACIQWLKIHQVRSYKFHMIALLLWELEHLHMILQWILI